MMTAMMKGIRPLLFGCIAFAYAASCWALTPVHEAEYLDAQGSLYVVTTFDDGSILVKKAGSSFTGLEAMKMLQGVGIDVSVNPSGHIMGQDLTLGAVLKVKPHLVTDHFADYDRQPANSNQTTKTTTTTMDSSTSSKSNTLILFDAIPSNVAAGTAIETQRYYESATHRGSNSDVVPEPVSGR